MSEPENVVQLPSAAKPEPIELSEETALQLRQMSFRLGIPEQELFDACLRYFIDYCEEHGHIPFEVLPAPTDDGGTP